MALFSERTRYRYGAAALVRGGLLFAVAAIVGLMAATGSAAEPLRIMPLGDSITSGYTDNTWAKASSFTFGYRGPLRGLLTKAGYSFQFVGASGEPWEEPVVGDETGPGPPKKVRGTDLRTVQQDCHRGYWGQTTEFIAEHISEWLEADDPDIVLLAIGINNADMTKESTAEPTASEKQLRDLVQAIVDAKPDAKVIVAQVSPYTMRTDAVVKYNDYIKNTLVPQFQDQGKQVSTVDQYANFRMASGEVEKAMYAKESSVHPSLAGYERMARTWLAGIQVVAPPESDR